MRIQSFFLLVVICLGSAMAQSVYLEKEQPGYIAGAFTEIPLEDGADPTYGLDLGFALMGMIDLGLVVGYTSFGDESKTGIGPRLGFNPLKPTSDLPIGVLAEASYTYDIYSGDADNSSSTIAFGGDLFALFLMGDMFSFKPTAGYRFKMRSSETAGVEADANIQKIKVSIPIIIPLDDNKIIIEPAYFLGIPEEGDNSNGLGIKASFLGLL